MNRILPLAVCLLLSVSAFAQTSLISDNFNSNPVDPNTVGWYSSAGLVTTFSANGGALQFTSNDSTSNVSIFKQFTETQLAVGQALQLTFDYTAFTSQPTTVANSHFRIGLFNTSNTFTSNQSASPWSTTNSGYIMGIGTGSATATSNFFARANSAGIVSTSSPAVAQGTADTIQLSSSLVPANVAFTITRQSETSILLSGSFTQNGTTTSFTDKVATVAYDTFDTLYVGYGVNGNARGFTIDNVNLTAVPEPGTWALATVGMLGAILLARRTRREA